MMKITLDKAMELFKKMEEDFAKARESALHKIFEGQSGAGFVIARVNGNLELISISISDEALAFADKSLLEDLITAAINQALEKAKQETSEDFQRLLGPLASGFNFNL